MQKSKMNELADFGQSVWLDNLSRELMSVVDELEDVLAEALGSRCAVEIASLGETSAAGLFDDAGEVFAAIRFDAGGQLGWVVWDCLAAVRAVERVLGSSAEAKQARRFSSIECGVLASLLAPVADTFLRAAGVEASNVAIAQTREALGDWSVRLSC